MDDHSPQPAAIRPPHPLALALIERLQSRPARVLEVGAGSGRNTRALQRAGITVCSLENDEIVDGALSTHALLHGTQEEIAALLEAIASRLRVAAPFFSTFGSVRDARFETGVRIAQRTFAPTDGDEIGVPHTYFDESSLRELLAHHYTIHSLNEHDVDEIAGRWAHERQPLTRAIHWFAHVSRR